MPAGSLLALLDDIATVLDDVALMTKVAAKKTAGVLGDDLAVNAEQASGVRSERELPIVWEVARGSLRNKAILVPSALALSAFAPWSVSALLVVGGIYLSFEGAEKLAHWAHRANAARETEPAPSLRTVDPVALERKKIAGAVRTDFVLSAEIVVIALGTVSGRPFVTQLLVLVGIALLMTVGVYGLVAAIVKLDDAGAWLLRHGGGGFSRAVGRGLLVTAPKLMKLLTVVGTAAMFLVGGGILVHALPPLHHVAERVVQTIDALGWAAPHMVAMLVGVVAGGAVMGGVTVVGSRLHRVQRTSSTLESPDDETH